VEGGRESISFVHEEMKSSREGVQEGKGKGGRGGVTSQITCAVKGSFSCQCDEKQIFYLLL